MRIAVLGPLRVDGDAGQLSPRDRVVLSVLTLRRPAFVTSHELADALWPAHPPSSWAKGVQGCVVRLRRALGQDAIVTTATGYELAVGGNEIDASAFENAVDRARQLVETNDLGRAHALLEYALSLWRGAPLPDLAGWPPGEIEASRLDVVRSEAAELLVEAGLGSGRAGAVLPTARQLVEELPGSERRAQLLARGLYLCGDQSQALATLRALRRALRDEGLDAASSVGELEQAILSHDAGLDAAHQADRAAVWEQPPLPSRWGAEAPVFVGRQRDVDDLGEAWASAARKAGRTVLVGGDAGAGKSRLVAEVATTCHSAGAVVLLGHCSPDLDRPYQPFIEPLQRLVEAAATGDLVLPARTRAETIERATLVAGGADARADVVVGSSARNQLYDAVVNLVHAAARIRPVVLVLEDLHWAGAATLELFEHLVTETADARLLVLATHRNTQPDRSTRVAATMSRLGHLDGVRTLDLEPLTVGDIEDYVVRELRAAPAQARQAGVLLREQSAGNAFFLREIVRDLVRSGGLSALGTRQVSTPNVIRDTYESRLAQLGPEDRRCLEFASVVGQEFDVDVVAAAGGVGSDRILHAVDSGVSLGIVDARPSGGGRFGFVHEIARQTVQQLMSPGSMITTHLMVAEALRDGFANAPNRTERLAFHFAAAQSLGRRDEAKRYLREAAGLATARLAHADAASFLERAIELARTESEASELRLEASAARRRSGDYSAAIVHASTVLASPDLRARLEATVAYEEAAWQAGLAGADTVEHLHRALDAASSPTSTVALDDPLVVRARGSLARALVYDRFDEHEVEVEQAISLARDSGDDALLAHALQAAIVVPMRRVGVEQRLARARELQEVARRIGDDEALFWAAAKRAIAAYVLGRSEEVREAKQLTRAAARTLGTAISDRIVLSHGFSRAMELGDLDRAEHFARMIGDADEAKGQTQGASATQRFLIARERLALEPMRVAITGQERATDYWVPGLLALYRELGFRVPARRLLRELMSRGLDNWRTSGTWELTLVFITECTLWLEERDLALEMRPHLEPLSGSNLVLGPMIASFGAADRYLGGIESLLDPVRADRLLEDAVELDRAMDAPLHRGYSLVARLENRARASSHRSDDAAIRAEAIELAESLGVPRLAAAVRRATQMGPAGQQGRVDQTNSDSGTVDPSG